MSQHLYKPVPLEPLQNQPQCVTDLVLKMMDKEREKRPQTPGVLRQEIVTCLEQLQVGSAPASSKNGPPVETEPTDTVATGDATVAATVQPLAAQTIIGERYQLVREIQEVPQGRKFYAHDLRQARGVSLLLFSERFLADKPKFTWIEQEVEKLQQAPHESLRQVFSLESTNQQSYLVEEFVVGPSLLGILRTRGELTAPELAPGISKLAVLADHATTHHLNSVDLSLNGVQLTYPGLIQAAITPGLLQQPLSTWPSFSVKVTPIDFSASASGDSAATWAGAATVVQNVATGGGGGSSSSRLLSWLAYELLGGPRATVESTGRVSPVPSLSETGNAILRRGIADDFGSSVEFAHALLRVVRGEESMATGLPAGLGSTTKKQSPTLTPPTTQEVVPVPAAKTPSGYSTKSPSTQGVSITNPATNAAPMSPGGATVAPPPLPTQPPATPPPKRSRISI